MRHPTYEQALKNQGVDWEYAEAVPLNSIDRARGLRNQARLENPLDDELVAAYALAIERGDVFPPVVLWRTGPRARWTPIDGNQRLAALEKVGRKEVDAYLVVTTDPMIADRITWTFNNAVNGKRVSQAEALSHAVSFCRKYGMSQAEAAKEWGLRETMVRDAIRVSSLREILSAQAVAGADKLTDTDLMRLAPLETKGHDILSLASGAVINNGLSQVQILDLVKRVRRRSDHQGMIEAIVEFTETEEVRNQRALTRGGKVPRPRPLPRQQLMDNLRRLWRVCEDYPATALRPSAKEQYGAARDMANDVVVKLTETFGLGILPREEVG